MGSELKQSHSAIGQDGEDGTGKVVEDKNMGKKGQSLTHELQLLGFLWSMNPCNVTGQRALICTRHFVIFLTCRELGETILIVPIVQMLKQRHRSQPAHNHTAS